MKLPVPVPVPVPVVYKESAICSSGFLQRDTPVTSCTIKLDIQSSPKIR